MWISVRKKGSEKRTRHKISLSLISNEKNVLKSKSATFANYIHQKDATIAINLVNRFMRVYPNKPIYTVHDCFVSDYEMSPILPDLYRNTLMSIGEPLALVNNFLFENRISQKYPHYMCSAPKDRDSYSLPLLKTLDRLRQEHPISDYIEVDPESYMRSKNIEMNTLVGKLFGLPYKYYHWAGDPTLTEHLKFFRYFDASSAKLAKRHHSYTMIDRDTGGGLPIANHHHPFRFLQAHK